MTDEMASKLVTCNEIIFILTNTFRKTEQKLARKCQWNKDCSLPKCCFKISWNISHTETNRNTSAFMVILPSQEVNPNWLFLVKLGVYFIFFYKKRTITQCYSEHLFNNVFLHMLTNKHPYIHYNRYLGSFVRLALWNKEICQPQAAEYTTLKTNYTNLLSWIMSAKPSPLWNVFLLKSMINSP